MHPFLITLQPALTSLQRVSLLNSWLQFERTHGSEEDIDKVQKQMPRKTKRRRKLDDDSYEEYIDYVFPADDRQSEKLSNLMKMAEMWKKTGGTITGESANGE